MCQLVTSLARSLILLAQLLTGSRTKLALVKVTKVETFLRDKILVTEKTPGDCSRISGPSLKINTTKEDPLDNCGTTRTVTCTNKCTDLRVVTKLVVVH